MRLKKDIQGRALCALFGAAVMVLPHGAAGAVENESTDATVVEVATSQESEANESPAEVSEGSQESEGSKVSEKPAASEGSTVTPAKPAVANETEVPAVAEEKAASIAAVTPQSANVVKTGWALEGGWYYYKADGSKKTGWVQDAGKWYYLSSSSGVMKTGWVQDAGKWYYMDSTGAMLTGWIAESGKWYLLDNSGAMRTGWAKLGGVWYYLNSNGAMKTGWLQQGSVWYYLKSSGAMATGQLTINGKSESFDSSGAWRNNASKGEAILNTAKAYQGAPYVWGGTTPAGWDCIGFVRYVYAQHGVSIGGHTTAVLSVGRQVSYSQAQSGDILYWPGHVAIYAGNGQNVGAWNEKMGTTTGPNSWLGTPTVIRVFG